MADMQVPTPAGVFDVMTVGPRDGRPVLLLHGFPESAAQWTEQLAALGGAECFAVAPDQRGYSPGARPEYVEDYRIELLVGDVLAVADHFGWQRFDLVGHDWGAAVAWATAAAHPSRIRTLTAVSVPHPDPFGDAVRDDEDQRTRSRYIPVFQSSDAEEILLAHDAEKLRRIYSPGVPGHHADSYVRRFTEPGALTAALNWYRATRFEDAGIGPVTVPTLYVWSTEDAAIGATAAHATAHHVTGPYRFETLEGVSHWIPEQAPDALNRLLLQHLADHQE
ncbi:MULTISPECIES: alpha/beta fold hydrolase [unclassified Streptomyces]|uniref:alpha/beta fold hydrolase n=1 Tax=unclassified Streptomyces TaxID=2593676 RepID=UPI00343A308E